MKNTVLKSGDILGNVKIDSIEDIDQLRSSMYTAPNSNYGYMSRCMSAGISGGWDDGICKIYRLEKEYCTCFEFFEEFKSILAKENNN